NEVYIGGSPFPVHHLRPAGPSAGICMGRAIHHSIVCFHLHDPARRQLAPELRYQHLTPQLTRDLYDIRAGIERIIQFFYGCHQINNLSLKVLKIQKLLILLKEIIIAFQSYAKAHHFITKHKLWKWIVIPGVLYALLFCVGMWFFIDSSSTAVTWLSQLAGIGRWLHHQQS